MDKEISVIISTFNRKKLLPRAIKSVFNQYFKNWELIIVDDASTDGTNKVVNKLLKKYPEFISRVNYIKLKKNSGSDTFPKNFGVKNSVGKYICFLDDDDEFFPDHLQVLYNQIKNDNFDIVYGDRIVKGSNGKEFIAPTRDFYAPLLGQINWIAMCDPIINKEAFLSVGGFNESLPKFVDWNLWIRLSKAGFRFHHISIPISKVYIHKKSKSHIIKNDVDPRTGGYLPTYFDPVECNIFADKTCLGKEKPLKVAIFTLTKDRLKYTKKMYETMTKFAKYPFDWFVVDQGSKDGTKEWLKGKCELIDLKENVGISKGSNLALDKIGDNYDIIIKVDNDCFFLSDKWLLTLVNLYRVNRQLILSPYVEGLKENPGGSPRQVKSGGNPYRNIGDILLGAVEHLGGICVASPAIAYKNFRWKENDFYSGIQDYIYSQYCRKILGYSMFYVENIRVSHGPGTLQQHKDFKEYFELRKKENTTKYEDSNNNNMLKMYVK